MNHTDTAQKNRRYTSGKGKNKNRSFSNLTPIPGTKDTYFIAALETTVLVNFPRMDGVPGETTQSSLNYCTSRLTSSPDAFKGKSGHSSRTAQEARNFPQAWTAGLKSRTS